MLGCILSCLWDDRSLLYEVLERDRAFILSDGFSGVNLITVIMSVITTVMIRVKVSGGDRSPVLTRIDLLFVFDFVLRLYRGTYRQGLCP